MNTKYLDIYSRAFRPVQEVIVYPGFIAAPVVIFTKFNLCYAIRQVVIEKDLARFKR
ncbi:MAG: hypothetical protein ABJB11_13755 [Ferruginibacter sp.]